MNKLLLPVSLSLLLLCGCAQHYVIKLTSGGQITTRGKPKPKGNNYVYKDTKGQVQQISQGRVREIEPASMARKEKSTFNLPPAK